MHGSVLSQWAPWVTRQSVCIVRSGGTLFGFATLSAIPVCIVDLQWKVRIRHTRFELPIQQGTTPSSCRRE